MLGPGSPAFFVNNSGQLVVAFAAWHNAVGTARTMYEASITLNGSQPTITAIAPPSVTSSITPMQTPTPAPTATSTQAPLPTARSGSGGASHGSDGRNIGATVSVGSNTSTLVDGKSIGTSSDALNTTYLTNGQHSVKVTKNGKTTIEEITVKNNLNPYQQIRNVLFTAFVGHPLVMNLALISVLLLIAGTLINGLLFWRKYSIAARR